MTLQERKPLIEQTFIQTQNEREQFLKNAEDKLIEMNKLQGEYRLIEDLIAEEKPVKKGKK